jgi:hypothetical protein
MVGVKHVSLTGSILLLCLNLFVASLTTAQAICSFSPGFQALHDLIPDQVGDCVETEQLNPATGNIEQHTTLGLLIWQQNANLTEFIGSATTWLMGPDGLVSRPNDGSPFAWEPPPQAIPLPTPTDEPITQPTQVPQPLTVPSCQPISPLSDALQVTSPAFSLPPQVAAFSGAWEGQWGGVRPSRLVVESIDATTARVAYAIVSYGNAQGALRPAAFRTDAVILPDGRLSWGSNSRFYFTMHDDLNSIDGILESPGSGVVGRVTMTRCSL